MEIYTKTVCQTALGIITFTVKSAKKILKGVPKEKRGTKEVTVDCQICNEYNRIGSPNQG